jgi:uncharacterized membrane protein
MTEKKVTEGRPWTNAGFFDTYELAKEKVVKINSDELQTKIRRRANGTFLVKYRQKPALKKEETKNVKKSGKSRKGNTNKRESKFDASSI